MIAGGSAKSGAVTQYFKTSRIVAKILATMFEVIYPEEYKKYRAAFDAGVWYQADPGPFGSRAVVHKLQVYLHKDGSDGGPTVTFPSGEYEGGIMEMYQLLSRLW